MKKIILASLLSLVSCCTVAAQPIKITAFSSQTWHSYNAKDIVTVQNGSVYSSSKVLITVSPYENLSGQKPTGINIKGCGNVTHVKVNSAVRCDLNESITFSSDNDTAFATGTYQIQD